MIICEYKNSAFEMLKGVIAIKLYRQYIRSLSSVSSFLSLLWRFTRIHLHNPKHHLSNTSSIRSDLCMV